MGPLEGLVYVFSFNSVLWPLGSKLSLNLVYSVFSILLLLPGEIVDRLAALKTLSILDKSPESV